MLISRLTLCAQNKEQKHDMFKKVWVWLWAGFFLSLATSVPVPSTMFQPATSSQRIIFRQPAQSDHQPPPLPSPLPPTVHPLKQDDALPKYEYKYEVSDLQSGDHKSHWERRDGDRVRGSYTLVEPDGVVRQVDYTADDLHGFNAMVTRKGQAKHSPQSYAFTNSVTSGHRPHFDLPSKSYVPTNSVVPSVHLTDAGSSLGHSPQDISTGYTINHSTNTAGKFYSF